MFKLLLLETKSLTLFISLKNSIIQSISPTKSGWRVVGLYFNWSCLQVKTEIIDTSVPESTWSLVVLLLILTSTNFLCESKWTPWIWTIETFGWFLLLELDDFEFEVEGKFDLFDESFDWSPLLWLFEIWFLNCLLKQNWSQWPL